MDIDGVLKKLSNKKLRQAWLASHAIAEAKSYDEYAEAAFREIGKIAPFDSGAMYSFISPSSVPKADSYRLHNVDDPVKQSEDYNSHFWRLNPLAGAFGDPRYFNKALSWDDYCTPVWRRGEFYHDFLRRIHFEHLVNLAIGFAGAPAGAISFSRSRDSKDYSDEEKGAITLLGRIISETHAKHTICAQAAMMDLSRFESFASAHKFTPKERETMGFLAQGLSNKEISERMAVIEQTVKTHIGAIFRKTGAVSRLHLISMLANANRRAT